MNITKTILTMAIASTLLTACGSETTKDSGDASMSKESMPTKMDDNTLATINGTTISKSDIKAYSKQRNSNKQKGQPNISSQEALNEYVNYELIVQDAVSKGVDKVPGFVEEVDLLKRSALVNAAFRAYLAANPLTDDSMKQDYDSRLSDLTLSEYKVSHILVEKEEQAKQALEALNKGTAFAEVAKKLSTGPSAKTGGDLGWLTEPDMLPEFREPVKALTKGQYAATTVKTRFGLHVVYLQDRRDTPPPPFAEVKDRVRTVLQRRQIETYIRGLREKATIEIAESSKQASPHGALPKVSAEGASAAPKAPATSGATLESLKQK